MKRLFLILTALTLPLYADDDAAAQVALAKANEQRLRDSLRTTPSGASHAVKPAN